MAWTETCKIDFHKQIEHKKEQGFGVVDSLKVLSEESGIPVGTLKEWLYPRERTKIRKTPNNIEDDNTLDFYMNDIEKRVLKGVRERKKVQQAENKVIKQQASEVLAAEYDETPDENIQILHGDFYEYCMDME